MRVTGKIKSHNDKSLSIQYSLGGLSFCAPDNGKTITPVPVEGLTGLLEAVKKNTGISPEKINLIVNTDRFVAVPVEIHDQNYDRDYLYAKNIICGEDEIIITSITGEVVVVFPVNRRLVESLERECAEIKIVHTLNLVLGVACNYAEKTKKHVLIAGFNDGMFTYAVVGKKALLDVDGTADGGIGKARIITGLLDKQYGLSKAVLIFGGKGFAEVLKNTVGKVEQFSAAEYFNIINENNKR